MKNIKFSKVLLLLLGVLLAISCSESQDVSTETTRLFRPVLNNDLAVKDNTITVDMAKMKSAVSYKIELSRDEFATVLGVLETTANKIVITNLLWNTKYQVRATAISSTPEFNSKISDLGSVTTDKFPTILQNPQSSDLIDISAKVRWQIGAGTGDPITQVKVFASDDEALKNALATYPVTPSEQTDGAKIVSNLKAGTTYQIAIYSGDKVRGWNNYTTNAALIFNGDVYDLRGTVNDPDILVKTLKTATNGSTILLDPTVAYNTNDGTTTSPSNYLFNKSVTIKSGYSLTSQTGAILNFTKEFNIESGSNIASIVFDGVTLKGDFAAGYVFSIDIVTGTATIGEIKFNNCNIYSFRGVVKAKSAAGTLNKFTVNNCIIHDIKDYGVLNMDIATWKFTAAVFTNSTIYKTQKFLVSKSNSGSVLIQDCTLNEAVANGGQIFSWPTANNNNVTNGITIQNSIIGRAWNPTVGATDFTFKGMTGLAQTTFTVTNSYATGDFAYASGLAATAKIPTFPNSTTTKLVTELWKDSSNGDFTLLDTSFAGKSNCGDPRWRK